MRHPNKFATKEAGDEARQLADLVKETQGTIGDLAVRGLRRLRSLPPDKHYPIYTTPYGNGAGFALRRFIREVSPKINANREIEGLPDLTVVAASREYDVRMRYFGSIPSWSDPNRAAALKLPFSRSADILKLGVIKKCDAGRTVLDGPRLGISTKGNAVIGQHVREPSPGFIISQYHTAEHVQLSYSAAFTEALAIAGLVAHGMRAYDIDLETTDAKELFNEWRSVRGSEPVEKDAFWAENNALRQHLPR